MLRLLLLALCCAGCCAGGPAHGCTGGRTWTTAGSMCTPTCANPACLLHELVTRCQCDAPLLWTGNACVAAHKCTKMVAGGAAPTFTIPGEPGTWIDGGGDGGGGDDDGVQGVAHVVDDDELLPHGHIADYISAGSQMYYPPSMPYNGDEGWRGYLHTVVGEKEPLQPTRTVKGGGALAGFRTRKLAPGYTMWWKVDEQAGTLTLRLRAKTSGWLGWGISSNGAMPGSDMLVAHARADSGKVTIGDYYATAHAVPLVDAQSDWTLLSSEAAGGHLTVTARRKLDTGDARHDLAIPAGVPVYLVWAFDDRAKFFAHRANHKGFERLVLYGTEDPSLRLKLPRGAVSHDVFKPWKPPSDTITQVVCTSFNLMDGAAFPGLKGRTIVGVEPLISSKRSFDHIHHMHLHLCSHNSEWARYKKHPHTGCSPPSYDADGHGCHGALFTYLPGEDRWVFPPGVGMRVGDAPLGPGSFEASYMILEQHFDNPEKMSLGLDQSGVRLWTQAPPPTRGAPSVLTTADPFASAGFIHIKYGETASTTFLSPAACFSSKLPKEGITLFLSHHHMHMNGQRMVTQVRRKGSTKWVTIHDSLWFQHLMQRTKPLDDIKILPGDEMRNECIFTNDKPGEVLHMGAATFNEMCMHLLLYYPKVISLL